MLALPSNRPSLERLTQLHATSVESRASADSAWRPCISTNRWTSQHNGSIGICISLMYMPSGRYSRTQGSHACRYARWHFPRHIMLRSLPCRSDITRSFGLAEPSSRRTQIFARRFRSNPIGDETRHACLYTVIPWKCRRAACNASYSLQASNILFQRWPCTSWFMTLRLTGLFSFHHLNIPEACCSPGSLLGFHRFVKIRISERSPMFRKPFLRGQYGR